MLSSTFYEKTFVYGATAVLDSSDCFLVAMLSIIGSKSCNLMSLEVYLANLVQIWNKEEILKLKYCKMSIGYVL